MRDNTVFIFYYCFIYRKRKKETKVQCGIITCFGNGDDHVSTKQELIEIHETSIPESYNNEPEYDIIGDCDTSIGDCDLVKCPAYSSISH